jgi:hypothetical protein
MGVILGVNNESELEIAQNIDFRALPPEFFVQKRVFFVIFGIKNFLFQE